MCSNKKDCLSEDNQELRIGTERVCASTVGPKVATPCQAQLHAERVFFSRHRARHTWSKRGVYFMTSQSIVGFRT